MKARRQNLIIALPFFTYLYMSFVFLSYSVISKLNLIRDNRSIIMTGPLLHYSYHKNRQKAPWRIQGRVSISRGQTTSQKPSEGTRAYTRPSFYIPGLDNITKTVRRQHGVYQAQFLYPGVRQYQKNRQKAPWRIQGLVSISRGQTTIYQSVISPPLLLVCIVFDLICVPKNTYDYRLHH